VSLPNLLLLRVAVQLVECYIVHNKTKASMRMITRRNDIRVPCKRHDLPAATTEQSIFYYLGVNHVFYKRKQRLLYFSDLEQTPVMSLLRILDKGSEHQRCEPETSSVAGAFMPAVIGCVADERRSDQL